MFISNTVEPTLTNNFLHPSEPTTTSESSAMQPILDKECELLYPTPLPSSTMNHDMNSGMSPNYQLDSTEQANNKEVQDHDVYLLTTYWPSDQQ
jgi:hypothetical protein